MSPITSRPKDAGRSPCLGSDVELDLAIDRGLLDRVIRRMHRAGLLLARAEVQHAVGELDGVLRDVTTEVLAWRSAPPDGASAEPEPDDAPVDVRETALTLHRVAAQLRDALRSAPTTAWPDLDAALRYVHAALLALDDVGAAPLPGATR